MMAKHQISHNARNLIAYCLRVGKHQNKLDQTKPRILLANLCPPIKNLKALTSAIKGANNMRSTDRVHHLIFAHPKTDAKRVSEVGEKELIQEAIEGLKKRGINLDDAPYVVIAHQDKDNHIDYHLIAASTDLKGKPIKDSFIGSRAMNITNQISKKYGLSLNNDREKKKKQQQVPTVADKISSVADRLELAEVETVEIDTSGIAVSSGVGVDENIVMAGQKIDQRRKEEAIEQQKKLDHFNTQCDYIGLTNEERKELWIGHEVYFQLGREVQGVRNDNTNTNICAIERDNRLNLVAVVEGVVKGLYEWIKELTIRFQKKQEQDDKARKQSQQKEQARKQRGYRFKR